jgi:hypothetical protein
MPTFDYRKTYPRPLTESRDVGGHYWPVMIKDDQATCAFTQAT